jgi:Cu+-exporting ATPase
MPNENSCIHCGADCGKHPVLWQDKKFCCNGCKQVFQLLNENKLNKYYSFEKQPGIKIDNPSHNSKYAYLDREDVKQKLFEFHENNLARVNFYIPGIHCASCIWLLENLNRINKGVIQSSVNFMKKELMVNFHTKEISLRQLVELLVSIHYIPDISLKSVDKKDIKSVDRKLIFKIGVAGFVFGNVMLYSLPEYFSGKPLEGNLNLFLSFVSFFLTIPVVFFSGSDYIVSAFKNLRKGIVNIDLPIAIGILTLFVVTAYEILTQTGQGYSDSLAGFLFFLLIGRWYQNKTYQSLSFDRDYTSYFPVAVTKIKNGKERSILLEEVQIRDRLIIRNKELVPADSKLIAGNALIDYSFVSGESAPIQKQVGESIYAGGVQTGGAITVEVEKEVKQSHLTQLWNQSENKKSDKRTMVSIIDKISIWFTLIVISVALSGFIYWLLIGNFNTAILVFTSVLIVACPCALALSMPFTFGNAMRMLGAKGLYLKNSNIIESITKINALVFDKTGTLTQPDRSNIEFVGNKLSDKELAAVISLAKQSVHPLSYALARNYAHVYTMKTDGFVEVAGRGVFAIVDQKKVALGSREYILNENSLQNDTSTRIYVKIDDRPKGYFRISNRYREGVSELIAKAQTEYDLYLLSGDNASEKDKLSAYFQQDRMHFNQQPADKKRFITSLQSEGKNVLMTGDGLNDAGAFMESNVALSVADDIYHFSPAGDAIIEASKFGRLFDFIKYAKKSLSVVKISFIISFLYNFIGLAFAITGNLSPVVAAILMPISSVTVVGFATLSTKLLAKKI